MFAQGGSLAKGDLSRKSKICGRNVSLVNLELETMMSLDTHDHFWAEGFYYSDLYLLCKLMTV